MGPFIFLRGGTFRVQETADSRPRTAVNDPHEGALSLTFSTQARGCCKG